MSKNQPGKVEKNSLTIGPPGGIEPTPLRCRCNALRYLRSSVVRGLHQHRKGVGLFPAGGPIVDEYFSTVPVGFSTCHMCMVVLNFP